MNANPDKTMQASPTRQVRWPAEWEPQDAVWLSWPQRRDLWHGNFDHLQATFGKVAATIARHARVHINASRDWHDAIGKALEQAGAQRDAIALYDHPVDDVWCRDHGAIFVQDLATGGLEALDWVFNAWGGKFPPWDQDNAIPRRMAEALGVPRTESAMILEGGAIEGNGKGLLLTTESVLLNPNRNAEWGRERIEAELKDKLGVASVFWLGAGLEGDDTDGHVDDMVRFVCEDVVVSVTEADPHSAHYRALAENNERLQDLRTVDGHRVDVVPLPLPQPIRVPGWRLERLPASYANFLIVNDAVVVPVFMEEREDDRALGILRELFPGKEVIGVDARYLVVEGGAIHCITQQQPRPATR